MYQGLEKFFVFLVYPSARAGVLTDTRELCYNRPMNTAVREVQGQQSQSQESRQIEAIRALTAELPLNDFGLPVGIYRTDLLPFHDYQPVGNGRKHDLLITDDPLIRDDPGVEQEGAPATDIAEHVFRTAGFPTKALTVAFMPLQYDEGYPSFDNGMPFWQRLEYEPTDAYEAFQKYLHMSLGRVSSGDDFEEDYDGLAASGTRSIAHMAAEQYPDGDLLQMIDVFKGYYHLYYWGMRAHAYDLCRVAQYRKQQEHRAIETQDEHYIVSRRIRHRLMKYFDDEEEFWGLMTPKIGLEMFKAMTQLERVSAGIPAAGPMSEEAAARGGTPFEVELQTVALRNQTSKGVTITDEGELLDAALEDPASTEILQRMIIRAGGN